MSLDIDPVTGREPASYIITRKSDGAVVCETFLRSVADKVCPDAHRVESVGAYLQRLHREAKESRDRIREAHRTRESTP